MIYLIANRENNTCKIGISNNPLKRLQTLQTGNSTSLSLEYLIDSNKYSENQIHSLFSNFRLQGEWFKLDQSIIDFFKINGFEFIDTDDFVKVKTELLTIITNLTNPEIKLLSYFLRKNKNRIFFFDKKHKEIVAKRFNLGLRTIYNTLYKLINKGIIVNKLNSNYQINSIYFV